MTSCATDYTGSCLGEVTSYICNMGRRDLPRPEPIMPIMLLSTIPKTSLLYAQNYASDF